MIFIILIFAAILGYWLVNFVLNYTAPEEKTSAQLIKKKTYCNVDDGCINEEFYLYFNTNGCTKKFRVNRKIYYQFYEGQNGRLVFKRKKFVDFEI